MGYNGRRMSGSRSRSRRSEAAVMIQTLERVLLFPVLLLYLELVLHVYMKTSLAYAPVYIVFSLAAGLFLSALTLAWPPKVNSIISKVLAVLLSVIYAVELIAKTILQSYYGPSALKVAAGNRLTDYSDVIVSTVLHSIPILLVLLLPSVLICLFGNDFPGFERFDIRFAAIVLGACVLCHVLGIGVTLLPWKGDVTPAWLY
ncbi:MAG: hypothetical protein HFF41_08345, partial [Lawsonibacter sp.]|nr:hypothetical protein [Lawsonibacter sp.]